MGSLVERVWRTGLALLVCVVAYLTLPLIAKPPQPVEHLFLVLMSMMGVHLLERAWLWRDIATWNRSHFRDVLQERDDHWKTSDRIGMKDIFQDRRHAMKAVDAAIRGAKTRVWILAIALSEEMSLGDSLLEVLREKIAAGVEVKLLLLDVLRSPAVFRAILESDGSDSEGLLEGYWPDGFFNQRLYTDFERTFKRVISDKALTNRVRFYGHSPGSWLVVTDGDAFAEQYTFGRARSHIGKLTLGGVMPVFKFSSNGNAFDVLCDHFDKLWVTSTTSIVRMEWRLKDKERIAAEMFRKRGAWFTHVCAALSGDSKRFPRRGHEGERPCRNERRELRHLCESDDATVRLEWGPQDEPHESLARACDYSESGLGLDLTRSVVPNLGTLVRIASPTGRSNLSDVVINTLKRRSHNRFIVRNVSHGRVGLAVGDGKEG